MNILAISLGRGILDAGSRDRERMEQYAKHLESLHVIVLTRCEHDEREVVHDGNLHIYPTHSQTRASMLVDAFFIGKRILRSEEGQWTVTAQDPFLLGLVSCFLTWGARARFHVQLHGDYFGTSAWGKGLVRSLERALARSLITRACGVRAVSERTKRSLASEGFDMKKVTVLPIRPSLERFLSTSRVIRDGEQCTFLIASRFALEKNIPLALRALRPVAEKYPYAHLVIAGRGGEEAKIQHFIKTEGLSDRVTVKPWVTHLENEMASADVFLLSSNHEAYGLTLVEAMAAGLPIVTTDVGCVGEVVVDGLHGTVVPVGDEAAYARALERMITDPDFRQTCGKNGREAARRMSEVTDEAYAKAWVAAHSCAGEEV